MAFDWLIKTDYFVIFRQSSNFWAQVSQDSRSYDEVTLVRPPANPPVRTAGPVRFHNDCYAKKKCLLTLCVKQPTSRHEMRRA